MTNAIAGHGATIAMEMDPVGSPGVYTVIGELNGDQPWPTLSRGETNVTPHQDKIDSYVLGVLSRSGMTFGINYIYNDATHAMLFTSISLNTRRGFKLIGPPQPGTGVPGATDYMLASGQVQSIGPITHPVRDGARTASITARFSGPMSLGGTIIGS